MASEMPTNELLTAQVGAIGAPHRPSVSASREENVVVEHRPSVEQAAPRGLVRLLQTLAALSALGVILYLGANLVSVPAPAHRDVTDIISGVQTPRVASGGTAQGIEQAPEAPQEAQQEAPAAGQQAPEAPQDALSTFDAIKPWLAAGVSILLLVGSLIVIAWKERFTEHDRKQAWAIISSVGAFWSGIGAS
jgi:hypothetical protein